MSRSGLLADGQQRLEVRMIRFAVDGEDMDAAKTSAAEEAIELHLGKAEPDVGVEFAGFFEAMALEVENDEPSAGLQNLVGGGDGFGGVQGVMEALA